MYAKCSKCGETFCPLENFDEIAGVETDYYPQSTCPGCDYRYETSLRIHEMEQPDED